MTSRHLVVTLLVLVVVLLNAAFIGLGSVFDYPDILQQDADEILQKFRANEGTIVALFTVLALGAALLAPIAVILGRFADNDLGRWSIRVGIAAAAVQGAMRKSSPALSQRIAAGLLAITVVCMVTARYVG